MSDEGPIPYRLGLLPPPLTPSLALVRIAASLLPIRGSVLRRFELARRLVSQLPLGRRITLSMWWLAWANASYLLSGFGIAREWLLAPSFRKAMMSTRPWVKKLAMFTRVASFQVSLGDRAARERIYTNAGVKPPERPPASKPHTTPPSPIVEEADVVIVGTGPAGATVARELAAAGISVVMVEEGASVPLAQSYDSILEAFGARMRPMMATIQGNTILQGRVVGGGSEVNSAIAHRATEHSIAKWHKDAELARVLSFERLDKSYSAIEGLITRERTPLSILGRSASTLVRGAAAHGLDGEYLERYVKDCKGSGRCVEGCPQDRKQSMSKTFIPAALASGARIVDRARVERVLIENERAVGVVAKRGNQTITIRARRAVVVAASAVQTPLILKASGLRNELIGQRFQAHPAVVMVGVFDEPVRADLLGATQGYTMMRKHAGDFLKVDSITLSDEFLSFRMPGIGPATAAALVEKLPFCAAWNTKISGTSHGTVSGSMANPRVSYSLNGEDQTMLAKAIEEVLGTFFLAGAKQVLPTIRGLPPVVTSRLPAAGLTTLPLEHTSGALSHLFGTCVMGGTAADSVCDPTGRTHEVQNLYVADSSLFPTATSTNPQHTVMAVAQHVAWSIADHLS
ncbi:MAG TPA: FAD-dependent oxidoreductase [Kofleriaceae bacterium]|jgi:choline dehydrogenase-like flavoprotein